VEVTAALIELKPDSEEAVTDWNDFIMQHQNEALETLRKEGVTIESWFSLDLDGKSYLLCYMRMESEEKSLKAFAESSSFVDEYHQEFKKHAWVKGGTTMGKLLLDLVSDHDRT
jgi:hypothetical protein